MIDVLEIIVGDVLHNVVLHETLVDSVLNVAAQILQNLLANPGVVGNDRSEG